MPFQPIDWSDCPLIEVNPRKVSGVPILKRTRMQANSIVENYESGSPVEEISYNFSIPEETIQAILAFAHAKRALTHPCGSSSTTTFPASCAGC